MMPGFMIKLLINGTFMGSKQLMLEQHKFYFGDIKNIATLQQVLLVVWYVMIVNAVLIIRKPKEVAASSSQFSNTYGFSFDQMYKKAVKYNRGRAGTLGINSDVFSFGTSQRKAGNYKRKTSTLINKSKSN